MSIKQTVIEEILELTPEKQQEVLNFVRLLQQDKIDPPTANELILASEIISRGLTRAMNSPS